MNNRKNKIQIRISKTDKSTTAFGSFYRKTSVHIRQKNFINISIRIFYIIDAFLSKFSNQSTLPCTIPPLTSASRLRRVTRDHLNSQFIHSPAKLCQILFIDLSSGFFSIPIHTVSICIKLRWNSIFFNNFFHYQHAVLGRFSLH